MNTNMNTNSTPNSGIAYLQGTSQFSFRPFQVAQILRVVIYTPPRLEPRPCFEVMYISDLFIDYVPVSEITTRYPSVRILGETEALAEEAKAQEQVCKAEAQTILAIIQKIYADLRSRVHCRILDSSRDKALKTQKETGLDLSTLIAIYDTAIAKLTALRDNL